MFKISSFLEGEVTMKSIDNSGLTLGNAGLEASQKYLNKMEDGAQHLVNELAKGPGDIQLKDSHEKVVSDLEVKANIDLQSLLNKKGLKATFAVGTNRPAWGTMPNIGLHLEGTKLVGSASNSVNFSANGISYEGKVTLKLEIEVELEDLKKKLTKPSYNVPLDLTRKMKSTINWNISNNKILLFLLLYSKATGIPFSEIIFEKAVNKNQNFKISLTPIISVGSFLLLGIGGIIGGIGS